jgi:AcrR family transcriptional regulator
MVRIAKYSDNSFIDGAIDIAAQYGIACVSMSAIAVKAGAPIGSVYHRFESRSAILARAWLKVKADFRREVASLWRADDSWSAVAALLGWCRDKPVYARFWLQCDAGPDFGGPLMPDLQAQVKAEQAALDACFLRCAQAGQNSALPMLPALRFLLLDAPIAMVKPYLMQNQSIPLCAEAILRASHDAVRAWAAETNRSTQLK